MTRSLRGAHQKTLGADKGYDTMDFMADPRITGITPHVVQNTTVAVDQQLMAAPLASKAMTS